LSLLRRLWRSPSSSPWGIDEGAAESVDASLSVVRSHGGTVMVSANDTTWKRYTAYYFALAVCVCAVCLTVVILCTIFFGYGEPIAEGVKELVNKIPTGD